jgi:hypothetical protein
MKRLPTDETFDVGLYDSGTGETLKAIAMFDVTDQQTHTERAWLVFTKAVRGPIVQLSCVNMRIHYFYDEDGGQKMIDEDSERFGFKDLLRLILECSQELNQ